MSVNHDLSFITRGKQQTAATDPSTKTNNILRVRQRNLRMRYYLPNSSERILQKLLKLRFLLLFFILFRVVLDYVLHQQQNYLKLTSGENGAACLVGD